MVFVKNHFMRVSLLIFLWVLALIFVQSHALAGVTIDKARYDEGNNEIVVEMSGSLPCGKQDIRLDLPTCKGKKAIGSAKLKAIVAESGEYCRKPVVSEKRFSLKALNKCRPKQIKIED